MKVALIVAEFPSCEHPYILDWVCGLVNAGIDLHIFSERESNACLSEQQDQLLRRRVHLLNRISQPWRSIIQNLPAIERSILQPAQGLRLAHRLVQEKLQFRSRALKFYEYFPVQISGFDLIHFNAPQVAVRRWELQRIFQVPSLVSFRGQDFTFSPGRFDKLLREADHLHFISAHLLDEAKKRGYKGGKHSLIFPMVNTDFNSPIDQDPNQNTGGIYHLFSAARFTWTKGWEFTLQALALVKEKGYQFDFFIAGSGELKELLVYTIDQLNLHDRVHLLGWQNAAEIRDRMCRSDLYLLGSVEEGFNNSVLQAQACGLPVVCSDAGGLPENIEDDVTGLLFQRRNAWDMADKIITLLENPPRRQQMGVEGRERAVRYFSLEHGVQEFVSLYRKLVAG